MINRNIINWIFLFSLTASAHLFAQKGKSITDIKVEISGLGNVTEKYVYNNIRIKKGDDYIVTNNDNITATRVDQDIVRLMKTGRFEDVQVEYEADGPEGIKLTFKVRAFPLVANVKLWVHGKRLELKESITENEDSTFLMEAEYLSLLDKRYLLQYLTITR